VYVPLGHCRLNGSPLEIAPVRFAQSSAHDHIFPGVLTNHTAEGPWLQEFQPDLQEVLDAKKKAQEAAGNARLEGQRGLYNPPSERSWLERHVNDSTLQRKCIAAMLESDSACGGSPTLLRMRPKALALFEAGPLPDLDCYGHLIEANATSC
jgi:hypothetical protein